MGDETPRTVLVDGGLTHIAISIRRLDGTGTKEGFFVHFMKPFIIKTKIGAGTEVTVEFRRIVALSVLRIEGAKIVFVLNHVFKSEIVNHLLITEMGELFHNNTMFVSVSVEPLVIGH
jgi:hypothetical protein